MNIIEKRDFIHSHLHQADERIINDIYEALLKSELLKRKNLQIGLCNQKTTLRKEGFLAVLTLRK